MVAISFVALLIVRYGFTVKYLAAILFLACLGLYDGFLHYSLDGTGGGYLDIKQGFGLEILGAHTQFWVVVVHFCVIIFLGVILLLGKNVGKIMQKKRGRRIRCGSAELRARQDSRGGLCDHPGF